MNALARKASDILRLLWLAGKLLAGRRFWLLPVLTLAWPAVMALQVVAGVRPEGFTPPQVQGALLALPLTVLAIGLGVRVIAADLERRMLETAYTLPGGGRRLWLAKLAAAVLLLAASEGVLALTTQVFFTPCPSAALYGALQAALVYLVLALLVSVWLKSEVAGAMTTFALWLANGAATGFGDRQTRLSPFWNPLAVEAAPADIFAWTVQNRIGFALLIAVLAVLALAHADRRERMLAR